MDNVLESGIGFEKAFYKSFIECTPSTLSNYMHFLIGPLSIDLEYPTLYPVHENNEITGGNGNGLGSNQPFHDNIYSKSVRVTPLPILTKAILSVVVISIVGLVNIISPLKRYHIR